MRNKEILLDIIGLGSRLSTSSTLTMKAIFPDPTPNICSSTDIKVAALEVEIQKPQPRSAIGGGIKAY